jgi:hypothetical protein
VLSALASGRATWALSYTCLKAAWPRRRADGAGRDRPPDPGDPSATQAVLMGAVRVVVLDVGAQDLLQMALLH